MSSISISEVNPFVSSDSEMINSDADTETDDQDQDLNNSKEIISDFVQNPKLPKVLHNIIISPQQSNKFDFLNEFIHGIMSVDAHILYQVITHWVLFQAKNLSPFTT